MKVMPSGPHCLQRHTQALLMPSTCLFVMACFPMLSPDAGRTFRHTSRYGEKPILTEHKHSGTQHVHPHGGV